MCYNSYAASKNFYILIADCEYSEWSDWSDCSVTCGMGTQYRRREVLVEGKGEGKKCDYESRDNVNTCQKMQCVTTSPAPFNSR